MTKTKRILALILTIVMMLLAVAPLSSCGGATGCTSHVDANGDGVCDNEGCNETVSGGGAGCTSHVDANGDGICDTAGCGAVVSPATKTNYVVKVQTVGGYYPAELEMDLYDSATGAQLGAARTDENGIATFKNLPQKSTYIVRFAEIYEGKNSKVNTFLKGYTYADEYKIDPSGTVITLIPGLQEPGHSGVTYQLGDQMHDFTVTDSDGKKQTLSEILKTKKAVILNFWFVSCSACVEEFPDIQAAYDTVYDEKTGAKYSDVIEVLALDNQGDTTREIQKFKSDMGLTFPMAVDTEGVCRAFGFSNFPSTVIIDRYGMVTVTHVGALIGSSYWKKLFSIYSSDNYVQRTAEEFADLIPQDMVDVEQPSSDVIADYFVDKNDTDVKVNFHPETKPGDAEYAWPFITAEYVDKNGNKIKCIVPGNKGKDNSYSIMYATMELEAGEAVMFDFHSSTESTTASADVLYIIVNGKDTYMISGLEKEDVWMSCCAFVAEEAGTYDVAFTYIKDAADDDLPDIDDVVYLRNLRTVDKSEVNVETYIAREAADLTNADIFLGADGYYHVGSPTGPILLLNFLGYTVFDRDSTVSQRMYALGEIMVDGKDMFYHLELYGNYAANSDYYGFTSVTEELKGLIDAYCKIIAPEIGVSYNENTWLSLCEYFNAYGTNGVELEDPIKGVSTFSAPDVIVSEDKNNPEYNVVSYERVIMPRGYLFKFVPEKSGVYRFLTQSEYEVDGWIFTGNHTSWAENAGNRTLYEDSEQGERYNPYLLVDTNNDGVLERDFTNASMLAYFEEGVEYYVAFGYYDVYQFSSFTFTAFFEGEQFNAFFEASPGVFTYIEGTNELIAGGIDVALYDDGYYYHKITTSEKTEEVKMTISDPYYSRENGTYTEFVYENDESIWVIKEMTVTVNNGMKTTVTKEFARGSKLYADFIWTTNIFTSRTMKQLIEAHAFDQSFTSDDLEALAVYTICAKNGFKDLWRLEAWLEGNYDETKHGAFADYIYSMTSDRDILEILFEKKWVDEDREAVLAGQGVIGEDNIALAKYEEWYAFFIENDTADFNTGIKPVYTLVYNYLKELGKVKVTLDEFIEEKLLYANYLEMMTSNSDELKLIFNELWIANGKNAALEAEGMTSAEIAEIKAFELKFYIETALSLQSAFDEAFNAKWTEMGLDEVESGLYSKNYFSGEHVDLYHTFGSRGFKDYYGTDGLIMWGRYTLETTTEDGIFTTTVIGFNMEEILAGKFHGSVHSEKDAEIVKLFTNAAISELVTLWGADYQKNWKSYGMEAISDAFRNGTLYSGSFNAESVTLFIESAMAGLRAEWGEEFDAMYEEYQVDDIIIGKFHNDFTEEMREIYNANIIYDENGDLVYEENNPERQGCVAVDARLAELLQLIMDKYSFENVENSWTKLCYYYEYLGQSVE